MLILTKHTPMSNDYGSFHTLAKDAVQVQHNIEPLWGRFGPNSKRDGRDNVSRSLEYNLTGNNTKQLGLPVEMQIQKRAIR